MQLLRHIPAAPLAAYVDCFWYSRGHVPLRRRERALPSGCVDLTFNLQRDRIRTFLDVDDRTGVSAHGAMVHGPQSRYFVLDASEDVHVIGVHFRPAGGTLLGLPLSELQDRHVALEDIWGERARLIRERLLEAGDPRERFRILESEFLRQLQRPTLVHPAISFALRQFGSKHMTLRVEPVRRATGYSDRRFASLFADSVGLSPKLFSRVQRLRRVVEQIAGGKSPLADIALANGYYDQAHFNRDFREFSGVTPGSYRPMADRSALHMEVEQ